MAAREKFTFPKSNNRAWVKYDNDWIKRVKYEDKDEYYSDEYQDYEDYADRKDDESEDPEDDLEAE